MSWCATTSAMPAALTCSRSKSVTSAEPAASRLVKGSSSIHRGLRIASTRAIATRRRCPADSTRTGNCAHAATPVRSSAASQLGGADRALQTDQIAQVLERA